MTSAAKPDGHPSTPAQALEGLRIAGQSRIVSGLTATQILADLGAEVIKIERPVRGDDTRGRGLPFLTDATGATGAETGESACFLSANRAKHSVAVAIADQCGQDNVKALAAQADVLVESVKPADQARYALVCRILSRLNPRLVYRAIRGFGQSGPNADLAGYYFVVRGKAFMSFSGLLSGIYAAVGILAAIKAHPASGKGEHIDVAAMDAQVPQAPGWARPARLYWRS